MSGRGEESLDQLKVIEKIDKGNMLAAVENFPNQCREATQIAREASLEVDLPNLDSILILGMGGSGIGGDIIKVLYEKELDIPIHVNKGYELPKFVSEKTLCLTASYSGNTEETLSSVEVALSRGCKMISVSTGGVLEGKALSAGLPLVKVPAGLQPRAALGYLALHLIVILQRLGIGKNKDAEIAEMISFIEKKSIEWGRTNPLDKNEAQLLAMKLNGKIPLVYGSDGLTQVAALRWKCQFNENSKVPSYWNTFSELNHNEIMGWEYLNDLTKKFFLIMLRDNAESKRMSRRIDITKSLIEKQLGDVIEFS